MDTQSHNPQENVDLTLRKLRVLWLGTLSSLVVGFYIFTTVMERPADLEPNDTLFLILVAVALTAAVASFVVKRKLFAKAEELQQVQLVQQGFVVAVSMSEVGALLGVYDYFQTGDRYYFVLFMITVFAKLLHFPRREPVLHATYKTSSF